MVRKFHELVIGDETLISVEEPGSCEVAGFEEGVVECVSELGSLTESCAIAVRDLTVDKGGEFGKLKLGPVHIHHVHTVIERLSFENGKVVEVGEW